MLAESRPNDWIEKLECMRNIIDCSNRNKIYEAKKRVAR